MQFIQLQGYHFVEGSTFMLEVAKTCSFRVLWYNRTLSFLYLR